MLSLFDSFLMATNRNKRMLKGGRKMTADSKNNYRYVRRLLILFVEKTGFELRIKSIGNNKRLFEQEKRYYEKLYLQFTNFLFDDQGHFDNYVGHNIKMLKTFLKWVNHHKGISLGPFYQNFHVWKEDIQIIALEPEQLQFLISDEIFEARLNALQKRTKDLFVFGCTVGLRVSDLLNLKNENLEWQSDNSVYLKTISQKTHTFTRIKLPAYAVAIVQRNKTRGKMLFRKTDRRNFNKQIKQLAELAGWTYDLPKYRTQRGIPFIQQAPNKCRKQYRFCDLVSTHTMRRTAITTMLNLGVDETTVRKISGHTPGSTEFYKYVKYNQHRLDQQTDAMFEKLTQKAVI